MGGEWLLDRVAQQPHLLAVAGEGGSASYGSLLTEVDRWRDALGAADISGSGRVVAFDGDFSEKSVALLLALMAQDCVAVPLASAAQEDRKRFLEISHAEFVLTSEDETSIRRLDPPATNPLLERLRSEGHPGLVLFTSGSTGKPKAVLHDLERLLEKHRQPRTAYRMLSFLLLDHIGGINTLLYCLSNGGTAVVATNRQPIPVCRSIERFKVEVLPTTPTFLNLLVLSEGYRQYDLTSLKLITYGTEVMAQSTLERLQEIFPQVRLHQTYGLSELGILRSKSREDGSLWVRVGGEGYETKVVDGVLWIRAHSSMLGYLNAASPFDDENWFNTNDVVEQDGEWLRFLGRQTDVINVGGLKFYPTEVENVLLEMENVQDVTVRAVANPLTGQCVAARFNLSEPEAPQDLKTRVWRHCRGRLARHMVPVKVEVTDAAQYSARLKRVRNET